MQHILNQIESLDGLCADWGMDSYRADQIRTWLFQGRVTSFSRMTNLPSDVRERLADHFRLFISDVLKKQVSDDGVPKNCSWVCPAAVRIECVLLKGRQTAHDLC